LSVELGNLSSILVIAKKISRDVLTFSFVAYRYNKNYKRTSLMTLM
jgi:hypothetical protein